VSKKKRERESPPLWIEENEEVNILQGKELFIVAIRISCRSLSKLFWFFFLRKRRRKEDNMKKERRQSRYHLVGGMHVLSLDC